MNADQLADFVVDTFNDISDPVIVFQAVNPESIAEAEKEHTDFQVFVVPFGETETRINRGDVCEERRTVSVVINGPIGQVTRATALQLLDQLKRSLRRTSFDGYRWASNETVSYWNPDALKEKRQFYSVFRAEYVGLG
jgi:hypothetical protein